jgi:hypothetical protein
MKLSDKVVRIHGYGTFEIFLAHRMADEFKRVELFVPWVKSCPTPDLQWIGKGIPGVDRILSFEEGQDEVDLFCFFDVCDGDKVDALRARGKKVFGTGRKEERLEVDRKFFKRTLAERGLPFAKYRVVKGIDSLTPILKKEKDLWVKLDVNSRGLMETFHHSDWKTSVSRIDKLAHDLGGLRDTEEFMIEEPIEAVAEPGSDTLHVNGEFIESGLVGFEDKDTGYVGRVMPIDEFPAPLKLVNDAMLLIYKKFGIRSAISAEVRITKAGKPYYIDACQRMGNPPAASISVIYKNLPQLIWSIAGGEKIRPEFTGKYVAEVTVNAEDAKTEWVPLGIKDEDLESVKLHRSCKIGAQYFSIPFGDMAVAQAVGVGKTREEAEMEALEASDKFQCPGKMYDKTTFEKIDESIKKAAQYGFKGY